MFLINLTEIVSPLIYNGNKNTKKLLDTPEIKYSHSKKC